MKYRRVKGKKIAVYEHLEFWLNNTTYADRLRWLREANAFVNAVERRRKEGKLFIKRRRKKPQK